MSRNPVDGTDVFDCTGMADGSYPHPYDCTRFISCRNGRAADFPCPDCNAPSQCQGSQYLYWNNGPKYCDWPVNVSDCVMD